MEYYSEFRLYTFVANHYLNLLQSGLQTAHVVSELATKSDPQLDAVFHQWAVKDKTIIICSAGNHAGVSQAFADFMPHASRLGLPLAIFHEDEQSMNGMATACGIIVPSCFYDAVLDRNDYQTSDTEGSFSFYVHTKNDEDGSAFCTFYHEGTPNFAFIKLLKSFRLVPI